MNPIEKRSMSYRNQTVLTIMLFPLLATAQSDLTAIVKGGEILVGGLITILSASKTHPNPITVESVCIKNKMNDKITLIMTKQTDDGEEIKKELVIQKDSKECFYDLPKGVYSYEIVTSESEIFKKGEYRFKEKTLIIIKDENKENPRDTEKDSLKTPQTKTPTG
ncbi:hypothetical protein [Flavobacterium sp. TBRC 19031]|uniref:hypothetical protein n=1 Tax=Flavobacterium mekongense TaxID=3379707 RepID=UPI003999DC2D